MRWPWVATNVCDRFILPDIQKDQAVPLMSQRGMVKAMVQSEKSWAFQPMQQRNNPLAILYPCISNFDANLPVVNLPGFELLPLTQANIFIQNVHAARRRLSVFSSNASLAK